MHTPKHLTGSVTERRDVAPGLWIVRIRPEEPIPFLPGQYLTVGLPTGEKLVERPYSVASSPLEPELEFFLEIVRDGKLSPHLYDVPAGGEVFIRPFARGGFGFDRQSGRRRHFMVATVTGVAPFVSIVRRLAAEAPAAVSEHRIAILQAAGLSAELGYREELEALARREKWVGYFPTISRPWLDPAWTGERGRAEDVARKYLDSLGFPPPGTTAYLCGNPHMIRNMQGVLERAGFEKENVRTETYWPAG